MLPLRSKMTPIDTGTSSDEKFTTSCSMLSSKMRKLSRSRDVTGRSCASVTEKLTSVKSTSAWTDSPSLICWSCVSCFRSLRSADWADADVPTWYFRDYRRDVVQTCRDSLNALTEQVTKSVGLEQKVRTAANRECEG